MAHPPIKHLQSDFTVFLDFASILYENIQTKIRVLGSCAVIWLELSFRDRANG